jgi:hypothetical protein
MTPPGRQVLDRPPDDAPVLPDVALVARRGPGLLIVTVLVVAAFVVGLVRPWDWLGPSGSGGAGHEPGVAGRQAGPGGPVGHASPGDGATGGEPAPADGEQASASGGSAGAPFRSPTCASPLGWRAATIETWTGRQARVWTAAEAVRATGPSDTAIPFRPIVSETVTAIGWCAPVEGADRPPLGATATLFRLRTSGPADEIPYERLEPGAPDAMGELLVPPVQSVGRRPAWAPGRYVIRLATPSGSYVRYLGLEVTTVVPPASPAVPTGDPATSSPGPGG